MEMKYEGLCPSCGAHVKLEVETPIGQEMLAHAAVTQVDEWFMKIIGRLHDADERLGRAVTELHDELSSIRRSVYHRGVDERRGQK